MISFHPKLSQNIHTHFVLHNSRESPPSTKITVSTGSPGEPPASTDLVAHHQQVAGQTVDLYPTLGNNLFGHHFKKQEMRRTK